MFMQTADKNYSDLLDITSVPTKHYCKEKGYLYNQVVGICRGYYPWHAAFNRIILLKNALLSGYKGWIVYLDADAFVADLDFDLDLYLQDKRQFSIIAATGGSSGWWCINDGVFLINMDSPISHEIINAWYDRFLLISDDDLKAAKNWDDIENDQDMLQKILESMGFTESIFKENGNILNYDGRFIKQIMRLEGGILDRLAIAKQKIGFLSKDFLIDSSKEVNEEKYLETFVYAIYKVLLGRVPEPQGLQHAIETIKGGMPIWELIQNCIGSEEFRSNFPDFIKRHNLS